jgi:hypothetical protein
MDTYEIILNATGLSFLPTDKVSSVFVQADSVSVGGDRWVKFYVVDNEHTDNAGKPRSKLVHTVLDEYVASVRNLGAAPPESQSPPNEDALKSEEFDLAHEPPIGTVFRLSYETSTPGKFTEMVLTRTRLNDGWMSSTDGHIFPWDRVYLMLQEVAKVEVAEFRTMPSIVTQESVRKSAESQQTVPVVQQGSSGASHVGKEKAERAAEIQKHVNKIEDQRQHLVQGLLESKQETRINELEEQVNVLKASLSAQKERARLDPIKATAKAAPATSG